MNSFPTIPRKPRRHAIWWLALIPLHVGLLATGFSQEGLPGLAQTKAAAEAGDAQAQDKLAGNYLSRFNYSTAAKWYEKAAKQGVLNSQWQLGQILLHGRPKFAEGSVAVPADKPDAIRWLLLAANQGHNGAQVDLGRCYEKGDAVPQDSVEAYKWYRLASQQIPHVLNEKFYLDPLILKLSPSKFKKARSEPTTFPPAGPRLTRPRRSTNSSSKAFPGLPVVAWP